MNDTSRDIVILGSGAIGQALVSAVSQTNLSVRATGTDAPWSGRITVSGPEGIHQTSLAARGTPASSIAAASVIFVCERANHLGRALSLVNAHAMADTAVIVCCNGWVDELIKPTANHRRDLLWRRGVVTFGVRADTNGIWHRSGRDGRLVFGPYDQELPPTSAEASLVALRPSDFQWTSDMTFRAREKWLINTALNTLCALHRLPTNRQALSHMDLLTQLFDEAFDLGIALWEPWRFDRQELFERLRHTIDDTGANENSMARDVRLDRPTESRWLAGLATDPIHWPTLVNAHEAIEANLLLLQ